MLSDDMNKDGRVYIGLHISTFKTATLAKKNQLLVVQ
jgi:hypothetical protein